MKKFWFLFFKQKMMYPFLYLLLQKKKGSGTGSKDNVTTID